MRREIAQVKRNYKNTPVWVRIIVIAGLVYLASPIDLIPDFIPVLGQLDDIALIMLLARLVKTHTRNENND